MVHMLVIPSSLCYSYLVMQLDRFLSWADISRNCNIFLECSDLSIPKPVFWSGHQY